MNDQGPRAYIQRDFSRFRGIGIWLVQDRYYGGGHVLSVGQPAELVWTDVEDPAVDGPGPTLSLPDEFGRALLDALSAHYGGATDVLSLRRDYDAERKRVDNLIAHLTRLP
jgi:hypothetical protein